MARKKMKSQITKTYMETPLEGGGMRYAETITTHRPDQGTTQVSTTGLEARADGSCWHTFTITHFWGTQAGSEHEVSAEYMAKGVQVFRGEHAKHLLEG